MDSSQLMCDEQFDDVCANDSGSASPPRELEREVQGFSTMVKPDFRASIPGYPAPARKGTKRPMIEYESSSDEDQPDLGKNFKSDKETFLKTPRGLF